jgi:predicted  nucleic acid-binding Zn-ribbon protein
MLGVLVVGGCSSPLGPAPDSWTYTSSTEAVHLQWAQSNGELTGSWQSAQLKDERVTTDSRAITGSIDDTSIALAIDNLFGDTTLTGHISRQELVLQFPSDNGRLEEFTFTPGGGADYNLAVDQLTAQARDAEAAAAEQAAVQRAAAEEEAERAAIADAHEALAARRADLDADLAELDDIAAATTNARSDAEDALGDLREQVGGGDDTDVLFALQDVGFALDDIGFTAQDVQWRIDDATKSVQQVRDAGDTLVLAAGLDEVEAEVQRAQDHIEDAERSIGGHTNALVDLEDDAASLWQQALQIASERGVSQNRTGYGAG